MIGRVVTADDVCAAVELTLREHLPLALQAIAEQHGIEPAKLKPPQTWEQLPETSGIEQQVDQLPALVIASPGLSERPVLDSDGDYMTAWTVSALAVVRGSSYRETQQLARFYAAAIRTALVQHPSLGGRANGVEWTGEDYARLGTAGARTIAGGLVEVSVRVGRAVNIYAAPPPDVPGDLSSDGPTVLSTALDVLPEA